MYEIRRSDRGDVWLVVQVREDIGREIVHGRHTSLESAIAYMTETFGRRGATTPTREERTALERTDARVKYRQRYKRVPTDEELDEEITRREEESSSPLER